MFGTRTLLIVVCGLIVVPWQATAEPPFKAGTAKEKITPEEPSFLLAWASHLKAEGVESELWVRALALEDSEGGRAVIVSADIIGFGPALSRSIQQDVLQNHDLPPQRLLLAASHTHNGPTLPGQISLPIYYGLSDEQAKPVHAYAEVLRGKVNQAIAAAFADLRPARLAFGRGRATFGFNRRPGFKPNPDGVSDDDVPVLAVKAEDGAPIAVVFTYACHGTTVMADSCFKYFGDYPGAAADHLESQLPGATALYVAGCGGDITPAPRGTPEIARLHGRALADVVLSVATGPGLRPLDDPLACQMQSIELPLGALPSAELLTALAAESTDERQHYAREMLRQLDDGGLPTAVPYPIIVWRFGAGLSLVALSGEVCVDYALRLKRELGAANTWVAGYTTEVPCYIPSERVLAEGGYEAGWGGPYDRAVATPSMSYYGWPAPLAPGIEERIVSTVHEMMGRE